MIGSATLAGSAFLPWLWLDDVRIAGVPDPAGFFVTAVGAVGFVLALFGLVRRRNTGQLLFLAGLAGVTTLAIVWINGPATVSERAEIHAQAVALVDNVALQPPPPVTVGIGLSIGVAAAIVTMVAGLAVAARQRLGPPPD